MTTPAQPQATLHLFHDTTFDLVREEDLDGRESLGERAVGSLSTGEEEVRHKVRFDSPGGYTKVEVSPDFDGSPRALLHLVEALSDRHSDEVTAVSGTDEELARKLASLLGVQVVEHEPDYAPTGVAQ